MATEIRPATLADVEALILGDQAFALRTGIDVVPGYLVFPDALEPVRDHLAKRGPSVWGTHLIVDPEANELIGLGGYWGPPAGRDAVEIGYSIAAQRRRRGHGIAAARLLISQAGVNGAKIVVAHTLAGTSPSVEILRRCGMVKVGEFQDPDDGLIWRWEIEL